MKEEFNYVISISDCTDLRACETLWSAREIASVALAAEWERHIACITAESALLSFVDKILPQSTQLVKFCYVNFTKNSKSYKIRNFPRFQPIYKKKKTTHILSTVMKNYLAQNLNLAQLGAKMPFFKKFKISYNLNARMDFSKFNPKSPWSLYSFYKI